MILYTNHCFHWWAEMKGIGNATKKNMNKSDVLNNEEYRMRYEFNIFNVALYSTNMIIAFYLSIFPSGWLQQLQQ